MAKEKMSVTVDADVLAGIDAHARAVGLNRSEIVERAMRNESLRWQLEQYTRVTVPKLGIDDYADTLYRANKRLEPASIGIVGEAEVRQALGIVTALVS